jgi:hypothetical protein
LRDCLLPSSRAPTPVLIVTHGAEVEGMVDEVVGLAGGAVAV